MNFNDNLKKYADLIIKVGSNVIEGDIVTINCPVETADFGRLLTESAYKSGAKLGRFDNQLSMQCQHNQPTGRWPCR